MLREKSAQVGCSTFAPLVSILRTVSSNNLSLTFHVHADRSGQNARALKQPLLHGRTLVQTQTHIPCRQRGRSTAVTTPSANLKTHRSQPKSHPAHTKRHTTQKPQPHTAHTLTHTTLTATATRQRFDRADGFYVGSTRSGKRGLVSSAHVEPIHLAHERSRADVMALMHAPGAAPITTYRATRRS
jgi:hypothetical protein